MNEKFVDFLANRIKDALKEYKSISKSVDETETSETTSSKFEVEVADNIRRFLDTQTDEKYRNLKVEHYEGSDSKYWSDIKISNPITDKNIWVETKLNKYANLGSASFKYQDGKWSCTTLDDDDPLLPLYLSAIENNSVKFIEFCKSFLDKDDIKLPTDLSEELIDAWKKTGNISDTDNDVQFITDKIVIENFGEKVSEYYKNAKNEPVYYIQVGDNLYIIDEKYNALGLKTKDGGDLMKLSDAHKIGRIQFRAKGLAKEQRYYYSIYSDIKVLADKENDIGDYSCSFLNEDKWPIVSQNINERRFQFALKDKENTWKPEKNRYAFKNKSDVYGGDDYLKTPEIFERINPNLHGKFGPDNWFRGPECLDSKTSKIKVKLDDGMDSVFGVKEVIKSKTKRGIIYVVPSDDGDGMSTIDFAEDITDKSEFLGNFKPYILVIQNKGDESTYVCNGMKAVGNDVELEFEWGDIIDYSEKLDETDDIGGKKFNQEKDMKAGIKIWIDDIREAPDGFLWFKSVNDFIDWCYEKQDLSDVVLIDTDHDAGDYQKDGGDYIVCFDYLRANKTKDLTIHIHSANPVGANHIRQIISRCIDDGLNWKEVRNTL